MQAWNDKFQLEDVDVLDRNGNLTYVRYPDGHEDWVAPHELQRTAG